MRWLLIILCLFFVLPQINCDEDYDDDEEYGTIYLIKGKGRTKEQAIVDGWKKAYLKHLRKNLNEDDYSKYQNHIRNHIEKNWQEYALGDYENPKIVKDYRRRRITIRARFKGDNLLKDIKRTISKQRRRSPSRSRTRKGYQVKFIGFSNEWKAIIETLVHLEGKKRLFKTLESSFSQRKVLALQIKKRRRRTNITETFQSNLEEKNVSVVVHSSSHNHVIFTPETVGKEIEKLKNIKVNNKRARFGTYELTFLSFKKKGQLQDAIAILAEGKRAKCKILDYSIKGKIVKINIKVLRFMNVIKTALTLKDHLEEEGIKANIHSWTNSEITFTP